MKQKRLTSSKSIQYRRAPEASIETLSFVVYFHPQTNVNFDCIKLVNYINGGSSKLDQLGITLDSRKADVEKMNINEFCC